MQNRLYKPAHTCVCKISLLLFLIAWTFLAGIAAAETIAEFDTTRFVIVDSLIVAGEIARPQICPNDSTLIAYEIHDQQTIRLIIHNLASGERRRIDPSVKKGDSLLEDSLGSRMNYDLAWRPVRFDGQRWAAYVSDSGGVQDIFLYNVGQDRSYCLLCQGADSTAGVALIRGAPAWSPDGKCLAYTAEIGGDADIYLVRGMDRIIERAARSNVAVTPSPLVTNEGNQFGPAWCPVPGSGYLAYTDQEKQSGRLRIKVLDILTGESYRLSHSDSTVNCFAPTWSAGGTRIAFYRSDEYDSPISRFSGPEHGRLGVGLASVYTPADSLTIIARSGGSPAGEEVLEIAPNYDRLLGPAWLPGGKYLAVNTLDEPKATRLRVISIDDWLAGEADYDYWLRGFGGDRFDYPRDLNIVNRDIAFSYEKAAKKFLMVGQIAPSIKLVLIPEQIEISDGRRMWWAGYSGSEYKGPGFFARLGNFLWSPIAGPDMGINRGFVPVLGGVTLLIILIGGQDSPGPVPPVRDWTPPDFPDAGKPRPGFRVTFGL